MNRIISVPTGSIAVKKGHYILKIYALGSCIGVVAYCRSNKIGGLAHVMLPGEKPEKKDVAANKYAENAIRNLLFKMKELGAEEKLINICIVGAGNVLVKDDDKVCKANIMSVEEELKKYKINLVGRDLGGIKRRSVELDLTTGRVIILKGNSKKKRIIKL